MRTEKVDCTLSDCKVVGERTEYHSIDYIFAFAPTVVRYFSDGRVIIDFDPPVDCEHRIDYDEHVHYLYCAPALSDVRLEFDKDGNPYLVEED